MKRKTFAFSMISVVGVQTEACAVVTGLSFINHSFAAIAGRNVYYPASKRENTMQKKAVILFSGGLDSTTCLAIAQSQGFSCYTLSFAYGQKHAIETVRAR